MAPDKQNSNIKSIEKDFVTVAFAKDWEMASEYKDLLTENQMPVIIKEIEDAFPDHATFAVTVSEENLDEAHVLIQSQDAYNDFFDLTLDGEDIEDYDEDLFDDDF